MQHPYKEKSPIQLGVFLKHVFRGAAEFLLELCDPLFDAENRQPLGSNTEALRNAL